MKQTLADTAYEKLLDMIYSLKYQSGDRLVEQQLINELEISRTPVREAIRRLAGDGLAHLPGFIHLLQRRSRISVWSVWRSTPPSHR